MQSLLSEEKEEEIVIQKNKEKSFVESEMVQAVLLSSDFYQKHRAAVMSTAAWKNGSDMKRRELEVAAFLYHRDQDIRNKHIEVLVEVFTPSCISLFLLGAVQLLSSEDNTKAWMGVVGFSLALYVKSSLSKAIAEVTMKNSVIKMPDPEKTKKQLIKTWDSLILIYGSGLLIYFSSEELLPFWIGLHLLVSLPSKIYPSLKYLLYGYKTVTFPMEAIEILYIRNQYRLDPEMQTLIEARLFEGTKFKEKQVYLNEFVQKAVKLPSKKESRAHTEPPADESFADFRLYSSSFKDWLAAIYVSHTKGAKLPIIYIYGLTGVGKTNAIRKSGEKLGFSIAEVSFAGATPDDLVGTGPTEKEPGRPGRIFEAIIHATPYGEKRAILYMDEIDKAFQHPIYGETKRRGRRWARHGLCLAGPLCHGDQLPSFGTVSRY
ncbi:MAG: hypothetical protein AAF335_01645 [Bacteroidota bacterium]